MFTLLAPSTIVFLPVLWGIRPNNLVIDRQCSLIIPPAIGPHGSVGIQGLQCKNSIFLVFGTIVTPFTLETVWAIKNLLQYFINRILRSEKKTFDIIGWKINAPHTKIENTLWASCFICGIPIGNKNINFFENYPMNIQLAQ